LKQLQRCDNAGNVARLDARKAREKNFNFDCSQLLAADTMTSSTAYALDRNDFEDGEDPLLYQLMASSSSSSSFFGSFRDSSSLLQRSDDASPFWLAVDGQMDELASLSAARRYDTQQQWRSDDTTVESLSEQRLLSTPSTEKKERKRARSPKVAGRVVKMTPSLAKRKRRDDASTHAATRIKRAKHTPPRTTAIRQLRMPVVDTTTRVVLRKYPPQFKSQFDALLSEKAEWLARIDKHVLTTIKRPAVKDLSTFWYLSWQFIFALLCCFPNDVLGCVPLHISRLLRTQRLAMEHFEDMRYAGAECGRRNVAPCTETTATTTSGRIETPASESDPSCADKDVVKHWRSPEDIFSVCLAAGYKFRVHPRVLASVRAQFYGDAKTSQATESTVVEQSEANSTETVESTDNGRAPAHLRALSIYFMYLGAIVQRAGEMFLKRPLLDGNIAQVVLAQRFYQQRYGAVPQRKNVDAEKLGVHANDLRDARNNLRAMCNVLSDELQ